MTDPDPIAEYYARKDAELEEERRAFRADPANEGKVFWPKTYID